MRRSPETQVYVAGPFSPTTEQKAVRLQVVSYQSAEGLGCPAEEDAVWHRRCVEENILNAKRFGVKVAKLGVAPVIPHANTDHPEFEKAQPYQFWIAATAEQLRRCDAIIMLPKWEQSSGARGEHALALERGMPVFYSLAELAKALS
jgi:hypothetical protein